MAEEANSGLNFLTNGLRQAGSDIASAGLGIAGNLLSGSQSLSAYSDALNSNTKILGAASKAIAGLVQFAEGSLSEYQQLSNIGATFGASIVDIKQSAAEMGLEVKDMTEFFMKNQNALRVLGGTTEDATQSFIQMSKDFLDSDFGTNLRMLGYDVKDINESLATFADLQTVEGMRRMRTDGSLNRNAAEFATTLDELSKLTGKQRDQIAEEMRQRRRNGQVQALLSQLDEEQAMALQEGLQTAGELGPGFETLIQDLVAFGAPVSDASKDIAKALPSVIDEYEAYANAIRNGASAEQAQGLLDQAIGASVEGMESPEFSNLALLGNFSDVGANAADMLESSFDLRRGITSAAEGTDELATVIGSLRDTIADQQQAQMGADGIIRQTVDMQEALRETIMYVQQTALPALVGAAESALTTVTEAMGDDAALRRQVEEAISGVLNPARDAIDSMEDMFNFNPQTVPMDAEQVILGEGTAADLANQLDMDVDQVLQDNDVASDERIAQAEAALAESQTTLSNAQADLAELTNRQTDLVQQGQFDRAADLQTEIDAARATVVDAETRLGQRQDEMVMAQEVTIQAVDDAETRLGQGQDEIAMAQEVTIQAVEQSRIDTLRAIEDGMAYTNRQVERYRAAQASGTQFYGGFDNGGFIPQDGFGIVGERGPEIVSGSANVTGRMKTFDFINQLNDKMNSVATTMENQVNSVDNTTQISNNSNEISSMIKDLNDSIKSLNAGMHNIANINQQQLHTEIKSLRATKGLQGNMLKGIGLK